MQMKQLLTILFVTLSSLALAQPDNDSWLNVTVQTDQYGGETSWEILMGGDVVAISPLYQNSALNSVTIPLPSGDDYEFIIYDAFGDGICCDFGPGWYSLTNACGLEIFNYEFNSPSDTTGFNLLPCLPPINGCMEADALNFNPWANVPSPCTFPPSACDSGQTNIIALITPDSYPSETSWEITANGNVVAEGSGYTTTGITSPSYTCVNVGDTLVATIYDSFGDGLCGTCWGGVDGYFNVTTLCGDSIFSIGSVQQFDTASSGQYIVPPCIPFIPQGCTNVDYLEYSPLAVVDDNSCQTLVQLGCTDVTMFNYDVLANTMDVQPSCDYTLVTTDGGGDGWFGSWLGMTQGDSIYGPYQMGPDDGYEEQFNLNLTSTEEVNVYFFTGGNAETTAAQCGFRLEGPNGVVLQSGTNPWTDPLKKFPYSYVGMPTCSNYCIEIIAACTDPEAQNFTIGANTEDGSCYYNPGCGQAGYLEYYTQGFEADYDDGSCQTLAVFGCTDQDALNYEPEANVDNNSCVAIVEGCMDLDAYNYNEEANTSTECLYSAGCITGPGEPYWLNDQCYAWVISVDPYCCEVGWDDVCVEMYGYCGSGLTDVPIYIDQGLAQYVRVYPNPTRDYINVQAPEGTLTTVYSYTGQEILMTADTQIDLPAAGVYTIVINYKNRVFKQTIVKQ